MASRLTVEKVKEVAMAKYNRGGDFIIECWSDETIRTWIKDFEPTMKDLNRMIADDYEYGLEQKNMYI